jgi:hypothetical protein
MCGRSGSVAPGTVGAADSFVECLRPTTSPSYTMNIVELTFRGIAKEVVGSNNKAIPF